MIIVIVIKRNITKQRRGGKKRKKPSDAQCNCSPPADQLVPEPRSVPPGHLLPVYILGMTFHGME